MLKGKVEAEMRKVRSLLNPDLDLSLLRSLHTCMDARVALDLTLKKRASPRRTRIYYVV